MMTRFRLPAAALAAAALCLSPCARATTYYVATNGTSAGPGTSWDNAYNTIQGAVDVATSLADLVLVSNGVYATGGRLVAGGTVTNRLVVTNANPITIQSVNGPEVTIIRGQGPNGVAAVRCVFMKNNSTLCGFTLTNGATHTSTATSNQFGGAVFAVGGGILSNCVLAGNTAYSRGGGACGGTFINCAIVNNTASSGTSTGGGVYGGMLTNCLVMGNVSTGNGGGLYSGSTIYACSAVNCIITSNTVSGSSLGGGAHNCTLRNCTITGNAAGGSGGVNEGTLYNCIVYYNTAATSPDYGGTSPTLNNCCTTGSPGGSNITDEPVLASASHLGAGSPCAAAGSFSSVVGVDIDGQSWSNPPSIGCDQYIAGTATGALFVAIIVTNTTLEQGEVLSLTGDIRGFPERSVWNFGDGSVITNRPYATHAWSAGGNYTVVLTAYNNTYPSGRSATTTVHVAGDGGGEADTNTVRYVVAGNPAAAPPYNAWSNAAPDIQTAIRVSGIAGTTVYVSNGVYAAGSTAAAEGTRATRVVLTNGIRVLSVNGPGVTVIDGSNNVRCAYLGAGTLLAGFTLTNGAAATGTGDVDSWGGGAYVNTGGAILSNCVIVAGSADYGGGVYNGTLDHCLVLTNHAVLAGGGICYSTMRNGALLDNWTGGTGGGGYVCTIVNCAVTGNSASTGGGTFDCTVQNTIIYDNMDQGGLNTRNYSGGSQDYCCTTPPPGTGTGNIEDEPRMRDRVHIAPDSPCLAKGKYSYSSGTDIDGAPWLNPPSIGCDEFAYTLAVVSPYGTPWPGTTAANAGTAVDQWLRDSPVTVGGTQYVCTGAAVDSNAFTQVSATNAQLTVTNNATLTWLWTTNFLLTTTNSGSGGVSPSTGWQGSGSNVPVIATPAAHWHFTGWSGDTDGCVIVGNVITAAMTQARSLTASFAIDQHTLTVSSVRGTPSPGTLTVDYNSEVDQWLVGSPILLGGTQYTCTGAAVDSNAFTQVSATNVQLTLTNNATLTWLWTTTYLLTTTNSGSGGVAPSTGWQGAGSNVPVIATADAHWHFVNWSGDTDGCVVVGNVITAAMTQARSLTANFAIDQHTLTVSSVRGTPSPGTQTVDYNSEMVQWLIGSPVLLGGTQYTCTGAAVDSNAFTQASATNAQLTLTNSATLTWLWTTNYLLTTTNSGSGGVAPSTGWQGAGSNVPVIATADAHWHFVSWSGNTDGCAIAGNVITAAMTQARSLTANFAIDRHTLTVTSAWGTPSPGTQTVDYNSEMVQWLVGSPVLLGGTQYVCTGAAVDSNAFSQVSATNVQLTLTNHATLTWLWTTNVPGFAKWAADHGLSGDPAVLFGQDYNSNGVLNAFEYAFGTNWNLGQKTLDILVRTNHVIVAFPRQDPSTTQDVTLTLIAATNLPTVISAWTNPVAPSAITNGKAYNLEWYEAQGSPPRAFFRLQAVLKP
jgi:hypothetical protein